VIQSLILDTTLANLLVQQNSKVSLNTFNKHHHDCRYYTKNQLKYPNVGGEVNWFNITSLTTPMSAVYYSNLNKNHLDAIVTPINVNSVAASINNPFVTESDLNYSLSSITSAKTIIPIFDVGTTNALPSSFDGRISENVYDTFYVNSIPAKQKPLDWSPIKYHLEYFLHRRNPYYSILNATESQVNWIDEDVDGNKVWIGERHIFTGGKDGVEFRSGSFVSGRAISASFDVVGLPYTSELYNNVVNNQRENEFANRQIIVYGGVEIGRNLNLLTPISGSQTLSAPGADASFKSLDVGTSISFDGDLTNKSNKFLVDSYTGNITAAGSLVINDSITARNSITLKNSGGNLNLLTIDNSKILGTQTKLTISGFESDNGAVTISGGLTASGDITSYGNINVYGAGGSNYFGDDTSVGGKLSVLNKIEVGGSGQTSTFESSIKSNGNGHFLGSITGSYNTYGATGFFGGDVLVSGGLTIGDYFETTKNLTAHGKLWGKSDAELNGSVTMNTIANSKLIIGQTNTFNQAGDTYIVNWTNSENKISTFKAFTREFGTSANIITLRMSQDNIFDSGVTVGPSGVVQNRISQYNGYWNGINIREVGNPNNTFRADSAWSGLEVKTYLSSITSEYKDSHFLLFTSNSRAFASNNSAPYNYFPNTSENFGWVFSDWFRTPTEETDNVRFPLHLIASKNYVDYRLYEFESPNSPIKINPKNLGYANGVPNQNDIIYWNGTNWDAGKLKPSIDVSTIEVNGNVTLGQVILGVPTFTMGSTVYVLTNGGIESSFSINLPKIEQADVQKELVLKFLDIPAKCFPININPYGVDAIDGQAATYKATVPKSAIRLLVAEDKNWIIV
jgi:hypothetical protein